MLRTLAPQPAPPPLPGPLSAPECPAWRLPPRAGLSAPGAAAGRAARGGGGTNASGDCPAVNGARHGTLACSGGPRRGSPCERSAVSETRHQLVGRWHDAPIAPEWHQYTAHLLARETHDQRVAWTQAFFAQLPPERLPAGRQQFGCFGCDPPDADGRARIHFTNHDTDETSPLSRAKMGARRQDLHAMFTYVQHTHAAAQSVLGGSWLYHLEAYRRLFPPIYGESRVVQEGTAHLQGTASWGQFLDHREAVRPALRAQFLANLATLDLHRLWAVFPLPT